MSLFHVEHLGVFIKRTTTRIAPTMIFINSMDFFTWNIIAFFCAISLFHMEHYRFYEKGNHKGLPLQWYLSILWIFSRGTLSLFSVQCRCFTWNIIVVFCVMSLFHVEHWGVFIKRTTTRDCPYNDIYQFYGFFHVEHYRCFLCNFVVSRGTLAFFSVQCRCFTWNIGAFL